ncbi:MAG: RNA polymerase sigma-70 factor [Sphingobacteriales bacterium]|nr:MAG: RNA polymerase sigma-70 factor [Sphingobacteriales bacterium]
MTERNTSFQQLFAREYEGLCRYAFTYLHDEHTCEDVVQDTFVKIWETKRELIDNPNIRFYLFTAVRNNCISYLRKAKTSAVILTEETPEPFPEPTIPATQLLAMEDEKTRQIAEALNQLPPKCREVFMLVKWQGLSYKDAAATLGISVKTVENQMGKAIKIFKNWTATVSAVLIGLAVYLIQTLG